MSCSRRCSVSSAVFSRSRCKAGIYWTTTRLSHGIWATFTISRSSRSVSNPVDGRSATSFCTCQKAGSHLAEDGEGQAQIPMKATRRAARQGSAYDSRTSKTGQMRQPLPSCRCCCCCCWTMSPTSTLEYDRSEARRSLVSTSIGWRHCGTCTSGPSSLPPARDPAPDKAFFDAVFRGRSIVQQTCASRPSTTTLLRMRHLILRLGEVLLRWEIRDFLYDGHGHGHGLYIPDLPLPHLRRFAASDERSQPVDADLLAEVCTRILRRSGCAQRTLADGNYSIGRKCLQDLRTICTYKALRVLTVHSALCSGIFFFFWPI